ncbi:MAG: hypothetical protein AB7S92_19360 [Parvibaculaceae bacterium]
MATLGDILGSAKRSAGEFEKWAASADPGLAETVRAAAAAENGSWSGYVRMAVADFSRFADEEAWAGLCRSVRDSDDPAMACLRAMVRWRMAAPACEDHASDTFDEERS